MASKPYTRCQHCHPDYELQCDGFDGHDGPHHFSTVVEWEDDPDEYVADRGK